MVIDIEKEVGKKLLDLYKDVLKENIELEYHSGHCYGHYKDLDKCNGNCCYKCLFDVRKYLFEKELEETMEKIK